MRPCMSAARTTNKSPSMYGLVVSAPAATVTVTTSASITRRRIEGACYTAEPGRMGRTGWMGGTGRARDRPILPIPPIPPVLPHETPHHCHRRAVRRGERHSRARSGDRAWISACRQRRDVSRGRLEGPSGARGARQRRHGVEAGERIAHRRLHGQSPD